MTTDVKYDHNAHFGNVITAMVTPMNGSDIDFDAARTLAVYLVNNGSDALVLSGTTGEAPTTHKDEKAKLIQEVREALLSEFPDTHIPLIAGVGSNDTEHTIGNSRIALDAGADALLVVAPYYSRPSQKGIVAHYKAVAEATELPVILYDVPGRAGVAIEPQTYLDLALVPQIVAIKDASGNVYQAYKTLRAVNNIRAHANLAPISLYSGDDSLLLPFLSVGAKGIISVASHIAGAGFSKVIEQFSNSQIADASEEFSKVVYAIDALNGGGQQAAMTKTALQALGVIPSRDMRLPNIKTEDEQYNDMVQILKKAGHNV